MIRSHESLVGIILCDNLTQYSLKIEFLINMVSVYQVSIRWQDIYMYDEDEIPFKSCPHGTPYKVVS